MRSQTVFLEAVKIATSSFASPPRFPTTGLFTRSIRTRNSSQNPASSASSITTAAFAAKTASDCERRVARQFAATDDAARLSCLTMSRASSVFGTVRQNRKVATAKSIVRSRRSQVFAMSCDAAGDVPPKACSFTGLFGGELSEPRESSCRFCNVVEGPPAQNQPPVSRTPCSLFYVLSSEFHMAARCPAATSRNGASRSKVDGSSTRRRRGAFGLGTGMVDSNARV